MARKEKIMKRLFLKKSVYALSYIALAIVIEIITFMTMGIGVLPTYIGLDLAVIFIFSFIIFVIPNSIAQLAVEGVLLAFQMILSIANEALYATSGTVFSLSMLNLINEVTGVMDAGFLNWWLIGGFIALFGATITGLVFLTVKCKTDGTTIKREYTAIMLAAFIIAECMCGILYAGVVNSFSVSAEGNDDYGNLSMFVDEEQLYNDQLFPAKAFAEFGTFGYLISNVSNAVSSEAVSDEVTTEALDQYFAEGELSSSVYGDNIYTGAVEGKNVVLIVIESGEWYAINADYTPTLYAMASEGIAMTNFYSRNKTNVSEAISIMGSYPSSTLYEPPKVVDVSMPYSMSSLVKGSGYTTNYFHANTRDYYSREEVLDNLYGYGYTYFLEDMPELKGNESKSGFYDFDKDSDVFRYYLDEFTYSDDGGPFYTQMMTLITHGSYEDLIDYGNYPYATTPSAKGEKSEGEMSEEKQEKFSEKCTVKGLEEYYRYIDSFPETYVEGTLAIDEDYIEESGMYSQTFLRFKRFQAGMMDLDLGVTMLANDLIESGEIEDTMFVFYADHSAYYDQMNYIMKGIDSSQTYNTDLYNVPFFIWYGGSMDLHATSLGLEEYQSISYTAPSGGQNTLEGGVRVDKFCSTYDVMPTILDILGYSYNTNLYYGSSVFSDEQRVFVSHESGIFVDGIYFSTISLYRREDEEWVEYNFNDLYYDHLLDDEELAFLNETVRYYDFQKMLEAVIALDYFSERDFFGGAEYNDEQIVFVEMPA